MRHILCTLLLAVTLFQAAQAQISVGATLGPAIPTGGYAKFAKAGVGFTAEGRYALNESFNVGVNIGYAHIGAKELVAYTQNGNVFEIDGSYNFANITAVAEYFILDEDIRPFVGLEIGAYPLTFRIKHKELGLDEKLSRTGFGLAPTVGALYEIADGLEALANMKYTLTGSAVDIDGEKGVSAFSINVGVRYTLDF